MKKLILLAIVLVSAVSCERGVESGSEYSDKSEKSLVNKINKHHEKTSSKSASDSLSTVQNISSGAGTGLQDPIGEVDPGDIKTPPRK